MYEDIIENELAAKKSMSETELSALIPVHHKKIPVRHTSLEHTIIDVIIAAHAKNFHPTSFSSLSDLVSIFSSVGKKQWGWC